MDLYFNLFLVSIITFLFIILKYTINPYVYIAIIMFAITGLVITTIDPLYIITGTNTTLVYDAGDVIGAVSYPIQQDLDMYNYIFQLFYLMTMIGSIVYWSLDNPRDYD